MNIIEEYTDIYTENAKGNSIWLLAGRLVRWQNSLSLAGEENLTCGYGGIGRRAGFRFLCRKACGFDPHYPYHFTQKNRLKWRFFCVFCSIFVSWTIAVQRRFQGQKSGGSMSEDSRWNRQIPNPSLTTKYLTFWRMSVDYHVTFHNSYMIA